MGEWLTEEREVANHIREGFVKLYTTSQKVATRDIRYNQHWQIKLTNIEKESISHVVTDEKISEAIWSLKAFKAPGLDGLYAGFFQRFWHLVGESVREEMKQVFRDRNILEYLNKANIMLIPKN